MPFTSPLAEFLFNPEYRAQRREEWRHFKRNIRTRDGKVWCFEALIFLTAAGTGIWMGLDFVRTGSKQSLFTCILIALMGWWPLIRHRLLRGDWPNDYH